MVLLLTLVGRPFFGTTGVLLAVAVSLIMLSTGGRLSPHWILRAHRARPIAPREAPWLFQTLQELARRADLPRMPALYMVPSASMNAFAVGTQREAAIGVTRGLLTQLDRRQLAGVLAHEVSHIAHRDLFILGLASTLQRLTQSLSTVGQILFFFAALAMAFSGGPALPVLPLILLIVAPVLSALLQLALSRTREFDADLGAARLTGDPDGLALALRRLEYSAGGWWRRIFLPHRNDEITPLLRTHPPTAERVARLQALRAPEDGPIRQSAPLPPRFSTPRPVRVDPFRTAWPLTPVILGPRRSPYRPTAPRHRRAYELEVLARLFNP